jgi:hypothetical protein
MLVGILSKQMRMEGEAAAAMEGKRRKEWPVEKCCRTNLPN